MMMNSETDPKKPINSTRKNEPTGKNENIGKAEEVKTTVGTNPEKGFPFEPDLILVEGAEFVMGCDEGQPDCNSDAQPAHKVVVSDFYIGKYEVTEAQWRAVMGDDNWAYTGCDNCPMATISWDDAQVFIRNLNDRTGKKYRLPTEAEWEFAAKGGKLSKGYKYAGGDDVFKLAWFSATKIKEPSPVGLKAPNELGIYDMSGNVLEWCEDWYGNYYFSDSFDPQGPDKGAYKVLRGGSWNSAGWQCLTTFRFYGTAHKKGRIGHRGVRLALDVVKE